MIDRLERLAANHIHEARESLQEQFARMALIATSVLLVALGGVMLMLSGYFFLATQHPPHLAALLTAGAVAVTAGLVWLTARIWSPNKKPVREEKTIPGNYDQIFKHLDGYVQENPAEAHIFAFLSGAILSGNPELLKLAQDKISEFSTH